MALLGQLTFLKFLYGKNNLGTPELTSAIAAMTDEQRNNTLVFKNTLVMSGGTT